MEPQPIATSLVSENSTATTQAFDGLGLLIDNIVEYDWKSERHFVADLLERLKAKQSGVEHLSGLIGVLRARTSTEKEAARPTLRTQLVDEAAQVLTEAGESRGIARKSLAHFTAALLASQKHARTLNAKIKGIRHAYLGKDSASTTNDKLSDCGPLGADCARSLLAEHAKNMSSEQILDCMGAIIRHGSHLSTEYRNNLFFVALKDHFEESGIEAGEKWQMLNAVAKWIKEGRLTGFNSGGFTSLFQELTGDTKRLKIADIFEAVEQILETNEEELTPDTKAAFLGIVFRAEDARTFIDPSSLGADNRRMIRCPSWSDLPQQFSRAFTELNDHRRISEGAFSALNWWPMDKTRSDALVADFTHSLYFGYSNAPEHFASERQIEAWYSGIELITRKLGIDITPRMLAALADSQGHDLARLDK